MVGIAVVAVVLLTSGSGSKAADTTRPLKGLPLSVIDLPGAKVPLASDPVAVAAAARRLLPAGDVRIKVADLLAADTMDRRESTIAGLQRLPQQARCR